MRSCIAFFAAALIVAGCSSANESGLTGGTGGGADNLGQPGCTQAPDCNACGSCYAKCACQTGEQTVCLKACGLTSVPPGSGGSGGGGIGGSGGMGAGGSSTGGTGGTMPGGSGGSGGTAGNTAKGPPAGDLNISEIVINQAVHIPIMKNGQAISQRNAPVVADRPALMRVYVAPQGGFSPRSILARLSVTGAADQTTTLNVSGASSDGSLGSTFDFNIPASEMTGSMQFSVDLEEVGGATKGSSSGARWPTSGTASMGAESTDGPFQIMLIPAVMNGATPNTSAANIKALRDSMMSMYPASSIQITVHAPVNYPYGTVSANGSGWSTALQWVSTLRNGSNSRVFYYAMCTPTGSIAQYCGGGCVAGLGSVPQPNDVQGRAAIGLGYFPSNSGNSNQYYYGGGPAITMAHELGHTLGRNHAPCAPQGGTISGIDPNYPYSGASIGVYGYNDTNHQLLSPSQYKDFMSYCSPGWISDYTYAGLFARESYVNTNGYMITNTDPTRAPGLFRVAIIEPDGTMHWTASIQTSQPQYGQKRTVQVLDSAGNVVGTVVGFFRPVADLAGGILYVRQSALSVSSNFKAIRTLTLSHTVLPL